ncbi:MAG: YggS family pyridoxal phosphate-dependent enzyme [bacterium]
MNIEKNIEQVKLRMSEACLRSGRNISEVLLVAVSKGISVEKIKEAVSCGIRDFGENYFQEAETKIMALSSFNLDWHFIGRLQKNKAKKVAGFFRLIHSLDSIELGSILNNYGERITRKVECLIEVNIGRDPRKNGLLPEEEEKIFSILKFPYVSVLGLMTITPIVPPEEARLYFRQLRELRDRISDKFKVELKHLSMGMSQDFEQAIEEGATIIRVGRAIFGERRKDA